MGLTVEESDKSMYCPRNGRLRYSTLRVHYHRVVSARCHEAKCIANLKAEIKKSAHRLNGLIFEYGPKALI